MSKKKKNDMGKIESVDNTKDDEKNEVIEDVDIKFEPEKKEEEETSKEVKKTKEKSPKMVKLKAIKTFTANIKGKTVISMVKNDTIEVSEKTYKELQRIKAMVKLI